MILPVGGAAQAAWTMSASLVASHASASPLARNVSVATCRRPSCQYRGLPATGGKFAHTAEMATGHTRYYYTDRARSAHDVART